MTELRLSSTPAAGQLIGTRIYNLMVQSEEAGTSMFGMTKLHMPFEGGVAPGYTILVPSIPVYLLVRNLHAEVTQFVLSEDETHLVPMNGLMEFYDGEEMVEFNFEDGIAFTDYDLLTLAPAA